LQYQRTAQRITSPRKCRHLKSQTPAPRSYQALQIGPALGFCNRAEKAKAALKLVESGMSPTEAARQLGFGQATVYREMARVGLRRTA